MTINYQNDGGFFTCLNVPASGVNRDAISQWFSSLSVARFRFINDPEILDNNADLKAVLDLYPGVKTIAIVANPWSRIRYAWQCINDARDIQETTELTQMFTQETFEEFVKALPNHSSHRLLQPQVNFIKYTDDTGIHSADYILHQENLDQDFTVIKEYFWHTESPLFGIEEFPEYKEEYTEEMKNIVATLFSADIAEFGYEF